MAGNTSRQLTATSQCNISDEAVISGSFELAGAGLDPIKVRGKGFTVTTGGATDYVINFANQFPMVVSVTFSVESAGAVGDTLTVKPEAYANGSMRVRPIVAGVKNDALVGPRVHFCARFHRYSALANEY